MLAVILDKSWEETTSLKVEIKSCIGGKVTVVSLVALLIGGREKKRKKSQAS